MVLQILLQHPRKLLSETFFTVVSLDISVLN